MAHIKSYHAKAITFFLFVIKNPPFWAPVMALIAACLPELETDDIT